MDISLKVPEKILHKCFGLGHQTPFQFFGTANVAAVKSRANALNV